MIRNALVHKPEESNLKTLYLNKANNSITTNEILNKDASAQ